MKTKIIIFTVFLLLTPFFSSTAKTKAKIAGVIVKYDKKTVTLSQNGKKIKVPRKSIPDYFKIRGGNKVYAILNAKTLLKKMKVADKKSTAIKKKKTKKRAPASTKKSKTGK